jgi:prepilin-type N-terminal cleavage/methylation domain-containing protein
MFKRLRKQRGFGLVEVIIALGLLGIIGIAFLGALATSSSAIIISDERATAESLARSEMEYVKSQEYSSTPWSYELPSGTSPTEQFPEWWDPDHTLPDGYENYTATAEAEWLDPIGDGSDNDDGLQKITITVTFVPEDKTVIILEGYKTG